MRHKLGVVILAAVMTIAGTREAFRQFGELKSSVAGWAQTSILGNLLVFAGSTAEGAAAQPPQTILLAETYTACQGERSPVAASASRPASKTKAASTQHAQTEKSPSENPLAGNSSVARGFDELARSFAAAPDARSREQLIAKVVPRLSDVAKSLGAEFDAHEAAQTAFRVRETGEAGVATRARIAAELKKLGLRKVYVRVAKIEDTKGEGHVFEVQLPEVYAPALDPKSLAGLPAAPSDERAPDSTPLGAPAPVEQHKLNCFFSAPELPERDPLD